MQETIPQLENEIEELVSRFVEHETKVRSPGIGEVPRHRVFEGDQSAIIRPDGENDDTDFREFSATSRIPSNKILYSTFDEILKYFVPVAEALASHQATMFFEVIDQTTKKTGNIIDWKGNPLSFETILEALEKVQIDFDEDGKPSMPTMVISPSMRPKIEELMSDPKRPEFERKQKEIIEKKRLEWRDREANRTLVG
ncbi:hypothetical protein [Roseibium sp. MMSF_3412]|uniref:hypothetical protein n=1 Tax=Roseibium sp. MMSF_3412 TaxID=3046712 RepID=UPI002740138B|nr:hypothetical protein [Roseibium sp. MMSF_3412]